ncbi:hypothetical protein SKP52_07830 [Sphingopyxis fribergensis]|uniref:Uncharacterized protein n=1 Tax=Sphingopyxis fribergensis TaxID=1515612 RepID=A0A0A7PEN7_9SPHN|nr:hypothetical protein SKP52_07830 [Sphingopyxis fribergensis]
MTHHIDDGVTVARWLLGIGQGGEIDPEPGSLGMLFFVRVNAGFALIKGDLPELLRMVPLPIPRRHSRQVSVVADPFGKKRAIGHVGP